ncbi:MAG: hypothetical protein PWP27_244 [Clostridiales bacterium]|jgi:cell fate (sporulation/competence/biofilm development) regulator YlbF (YheA/YmcA/DUF963 family)|nr:hypothetical protein [Clostridiales bacterium]MDK2932434.1 hypothetical protein [Clostridiales bacterium]
MDIIEKARELGKMLVESEQYLRLKDAEIAQLNDKEAQKLLKYYNDRKNRTMSAIKQGELTADELKKIQQQLQNDFENMMQNQNIKEYVEAKRDFEQLVYTINSVINYYINGINNEEKKGCSSSRCGSCKGCS